MGIGSVGGIETRLLWLKIFVHKTYGLMGRNEESRLLQEHLLRGANQLHSVATDAAGELGVGLTAFLSRAATYANNALPHSARAAVSRFAFVRSSCIPRHGRCLGVR